MFLMTQRNTEFRQSQAKPLNRIDPVFNQQLFPPLTWVDGWITDQLCQFFWVGDLNHVLHPSIATDHVQNKEITQDELQIKETYEKAFLCTVDMKHSFCFWTWLFWMYFQAWRMLY